MTGEEALELVAGAIEHTEENNISRTKMAQWLHSKFKIAIKQLVVNTEDGLPYLEIEYLDEDNEVQFCYLSMEKYKDKLEKELTTYKMFD